MHGLRPSTTAAAFAMLLSVLPASAQDSTIDWWTVDGGGEIAASGGDWELSGSFGQWDATDNAASSGASWELTGGFWGLDTGSDFLFKDGYES